MHLIDAPGEPGAPPALNAHLHAMSERIEEDLAFRAGSSLFAAIPAAHVRRAPAVSPLL